MEHENVYVCEVCQCSSPELEVINIHMREHDAESAAQELTERQSADLTNNQALLKWSSGMTLQLIALVEQYDKQFQNSVKQFIWKKIATENNEIHTTTLTAMQVDTKWKGLKRTYHDIKKHNLKSENNIKKWQFFDPMHNFLFKKPEIYPIATCSSQAGLIIEENRSDTLKETFNPGQPNETPKKRPLEDSSCNEYKAAYSSKRKGTSVSDRHTEKMVGNDEFLNLFERFVVAFEQQPSKEDTAKK